MRQQINLYQDVLIDKPEPLQARQAGLILLAFIGLLALLSLFSYWQLRSASQQLASLQQQQQALEAQVVALEQQFPERQQSVLLVEQIKRVEEQLTGQKRLLSLFADRDEDGNQRLIDTLEGLARHRSPGVWLRRIRLAEAGGNVALAGSALHPEQVPRYLQELSEQRVLGGQVFSRLQIARLKEKPGQVDFSLESAQGEQ